MGDNIPEQGIYPFTKALALAQELELDLVEISAKADPPVCKILDYQKYLYQQRKRAKEMKANAAKIVIKEIRFGPNTDEHDFQFKLKHAQEFLQEGSKVKASIFFRGRSIQFAEQGEKQLLRFAVELEEYGRPESMPTLEATPVPKSASRLPDRERSRGSTLITATSSPRRPRSRNVTLITSQSLRRTITVV